MTFSTGGAADREARATAPRSIPQLRGARPSRDLDAATRFYTIAMGLEVLASFRDHAGFDGVMLGHPGWPYHLELTRRPADPVAPTPNEEDLLVLYLPDREDWQRAVERMRDCGGTAVAPSNPYWAERGATFEDPDGYRIVLENAPWP